MVFQFTCEFVEATVDWWIAYAGTVKAERDNLEAELERARAALRAAETEIVALNRDKQVLIGVINTRGSERG
jgi:cob(I)alamin adenosyltransferase